MTETLCSRTVCQKPDAVCVHRQTGRPYCLNCAVAINRANPEIFELVHIPWTKFFFSGRCMYPVELGEPLNNPFCDLPIGYLVWVDSRRPMPDDNLCDLLKPGRPYGYAIRYHVEH